MLRFGCDQGFRVVFSHKFGNACSPSPRLGQPSSFAVAGYTFLEKVYENCSKLVGNPELRVYLIPPSSLHFARHEI